MNILKIILQKLLAQNFELFKRKHGFASKYDIGNCLLKDIQKGCAARVSSCPDATKSGF